MKIDIRSPECLYIEINGKTFYIDDSTNESIIENWENVINKDIYYSKETNK